METRECHIHLEDLTIATGSAAKIAVKIVSQKNSVIFSWKSDVKSIEHKIDTKLPVLSFFGITDVESLYQIQVNINNSAARRKEVSNIILKQADFVLRHSNFDSHPIQISGPSNVLLKIEYSLTSPVTMEYQLLRSNTRSFALQELETLISTVRIETYFSYEPLVTELFNLLKKYIRKPKIINSDGDKVESLWTAVISNSKLLNLILKLLPDLSSRLWSVIVRDNCRHHRQYHIAFLILKALSGKHGGEKHLPTFISAFCEICTNHCQCPTSNTSDPVSSATMVSPSSLLYLLPYLASVISCHDHSFVSRIIAHTDLLKNLRSALAFAIQSGMQSEFCSPLFGLVRYFGLASASELDKYGIFEPIRTMALDSSLPMRQVQAFSTLEKFGQANNVSILTDCAKVTSDLSVQLSYLQATKNMVASKNMERNDSVALAASVAPFLGSKLEPAVSLSSDILKSLELTLEEGISLELGTQYCQLLELPDSSPIALDYFLYQMTRWFESCLVNSKSSRRVSASSDHRPSRREDSGVHPLGGTILENSTHEGVYFQHVELPSPFVNHLKASYFFRCLSAAVAIKFRDYRFQYHVALWLALCRDNLILEPYSEYLSFVDSLSEVISAHPIPIGPTQRQYMQDIFLPFTLLRMGVLAKNPNYPSSRSNALKLKELLSKQSLSSVLASLNPIFNLNSGPPSKAGIYPYASLSSIIKCSWHSYTSYLISDLIDLVVLRLRHLDALIEVLILNVISKAFGKAGKVELLLLLCQRAPSVVKRYRGPIAPYDAPTAPEYDQFQILTCSLALGLDSNSFFEHLNEDEALQIIHWLSHAFEATLWMDPSSVAISKFDATLLTEKEFLDIATTLLALHMAFDLRGTKLAQVSCRSPFKPWYQQPGIIDYFMRSESEAPHLMGLKTILVSYLSVLENSCVYSSSKTYQDVNFTSFIQSPPVRFATLEAILKDLIWSSTCPCPTRIKNFVESLHQGWFGKDGMKSVLEQRQYGGRLSFLFYLTHLALFLTAYNDTTSLQKKRKKKCRLEPTITRSFAKSFVVQSLRLLDFPALPVSTDWANTIWPVNWRGHTPGIGDWIVGVTSAIPDQISTNPDYGLLNQFAEFDWQERMQLLKKALEVLGTVWESIPLNAVLKVDDNSILELLGRVLNLRHGADRVAAEELARVQASYMTYALRPFCLASIYPCPSVNKFALSWLTTTAWKRLFPSSAQPYLTSRPFLASVDVGSPYLYMPKGGEWWHRYYRHMFTMHFNDPITISQLVFALKSFMIENTTAARSISKSLQPMLLQYGLHLRELIRDPMRWELENILRPTDELVQSAHSIDAKSSDYSSSYGTRRIHSAHGYVLPQKRIPISPSLASNIAVSPTNAFKQYSKKNEASPNFSYLQPYLETGTWTDLDELAWFTFPTPQAPTMRCTPTDFSSHRSRHEHHFLMKMPKTYRPFVFNVEPAVLRDLRKFTVGIEKGLRIEDKRREGINERVRIYASAFCEAITSMSEYLALLENMPVDKKVSTYFKEENCPSNRDSSLLEDSLTLNDPLHSVSFVAIMIAEFYAGDDISRFRNVTVPSGPSTGEHSITGSNKANAVGFQTNTENMASSGLKISKNFLESDFLTHTAWKVFGSLMKIPEALDLTVKVPLGLGTLELLKIEATKEDSVLSPSHPLWLSSVLPVIASVAPYLGISIYEPCPTFHSFAASPNKSIEREGSETGSVACLMADYFLSLVSLVDKDLDEMIYVLQKTSEVRPVSRHQLPPLGTGTVLDISFKEEASGSLSSEYARLEKWNSRMDRLGFYLQLMLNLLQFNIPIDTNQLLYGTVAPEHFGCPDLDADPLDGLHGPFLQKLMSSLCLLSNQKRILWPGVGHSRRDIRVTNGVQFLLIHIFSTPEIAAVALSHSFWAQWVGKNFVNAVSGYLNELPFCIAKLMALSGHLEGDTKFPDYRDRLSRHIGEQVLISLRQSSFISSFTLLPMVCLATHHQQSFDDWCIDRYSHLIQDHVLICFLCDIWNARPGAPSGLFKRGAILGMYTFHAFLERRWVADANETKAGNRFLPSYSDNPSLKRYSSALYESKRPGSLKRTLSDATSSSLQDPALSVQAADLVSLEPHETYYPTLYLGVPDPASSDDIDWHAYARAAPALGNSSSLLIYALHALRVDMGVVDSLDLMPGDVKSCKTYLRNLDLKNFVPFVPDQISYDISKEDFQSNGLVVTRTCPSSIDHIVIPTNKVVNVWWPKLEIEQLGETDRKLFKLQLDGPFSKDGVATFRIGWATSNGLKRLNEHPFVLVGDVKGTFGFSFIESGCFNEGRYTSLTKTTNLRAIQVSRAPKRSSPIHLEYHPKNRSIHAHTIVRSQDGTFEKTFPMLLSMLLPAIKDEVLFPVCSFTSLHCFHLA